MGNEHDPMGVVTSDRHLELDDPFPYTYKICAMCKETLPEDEMRNHLGLLHGVVV